MSSKDLPQEIHRNILERLPAKTLITFRSVSKSWYSMITDPLFIASHLNRGKLCGNGYLFDMPTSNGYERYRQMCHVICDRTFVPRFNLPYPFDCESFDVTGSYNGLLCLTDADNRYFGRNVYLWNPSIRKLKSLPISSHVRPQFLDTRTFVVLGFGFDHISGDYKIVRLSYSTSKEECVGAIQSETEVYTLQTNSWRRITSPVLCPARRSSNAFVSGSIHWIAHKRKGPDDFKIILSFDFSNEVFNELMLPASCCNGTGIQSLEGFHGSLSLLICDNPPDNSGFPECCYLWVMKKYGDAESWVRQFKLVVEGGIFGLSGLTTTGQIIYHNLRVQHFLCDPVDGRPRNTGHLGLTFDLVSFSESLVLLEEH